VSLDCLLRVANVFRHSFELMRAVKRKRRLKHVFLCCSGIRTKLEVEVLLYSTHRGVWLEGGRAEVSNRILGDS